MTEQRTADPTDPASQYFGWVFYKHPDGQWVTLRKATEGELSRARTILEFETMARTAEATL